MKPLPENQQQAVKDTETRKSSLFSMFFMSHGILYPQNINRSQLSREPGKSLLLRRKEKLQVLETKGKIIDI